MLKDVGANMYPGEVASFTAREPETQILLKDKSNTSSL